MVTRENGQSIPQAHRDRVERIVAGALRIIRSRLDLLPANPGRLERLQTVLIHFLFEHLALEHDRDREVEALDLERVL